MEEVRVCRACGDITPADMRGRCEVCGWYSEFAIMSRPAAEQFVRRRQRKSKRRRRLRLVVILAALGGGIFWALGAYFDLGPRPPRATTSLSASSAPHMWAQHRRSPHNSGFTPDTAPFPQQIAWTYSTPKPLLASPAVVAPHVYVTTADGRALALEQRTGQVVWEYHTGWLSSSAPAVADDTVIVAIRPGRVVALHRRTGTLRWETDLRHPISASPIVEQGTVYIGAADKTLYALDAATGQQRWAFTTKDWIVAAVAYAGERIIVASQSSLLHVVGAQTGRQRFIYDTGMGRHIGASPAVAGDLVYFGSVGGRVWAVNWQTTTYPLERTLLFWQNNLYVWGLLSNPPVQKGSVWSRRVRGDVRHPPAIAHDTVYVNTSQRWVVALDATTGNERWQTNLGVDITAAPTVAGTTVLIGTNDGVVFGLQAQTGEILWEFKTAGKITDSPVVAGNMMYVVSQDGTLYAVTKAE